MFDGCDEAQYVYSEHIHCKSRVDALLEEPRTLRLISPPSMALVAQRHGLSHAAGIFFRVTQGQTITHLQIDTCELLRRRSRTEFAPVFYGWAWVCGC